MSRNSINIIISLLFTCSILVFFSLLQSKSEVKSNLKSKPEVKSNTAITWHEKIKEYLENEEFDSAINYIDIIYHQNPNNINILIGRADVYFQDNQTGVSKECWEKCLELDPNNIVCAERLVDLYCTIGDINCETSIDYLLNFDSNNLTALYFKAKLSRDLGSVELAINTYKEMLEIEPTNLKALEDLAVLYTYENNDLAAQYFELLLKEKSTYKIYYNYGYFFQLKEDFLSAIEKYKKSISLNEYWPYSYYAMGYCFLEISRYEKEAVSQKENLLNALKSFDKTISIDGGYLEAYYSRGRCYQYLGDKKSAMEDFKFCLMIEPGHEPAMDAITILEKNN